MPKRQYKLSLSSALLAALVLSGCGSGSGDGGSGTPGPAPSNPDPAPTGLSVDGGAVKGPLVNATVEAFRLDYSTADLRGELIDSGTTDDAARFAGLELGLEQAPVLIVVSANSDTLDLTTGAAPVITKLQTVLTASQLQDGIPIYATPLTSIAVSIAAGKGVKAETLEQLLTDAQNQVKSTLGFGMDGKIDIFSTPPLLTDETTSAEEQQAVAEYRLAVEAVSALLNDIAVKTTSTDDNADDILDAIAADLSDGEIDGTVDGEAIDAFHGTIVADEIQQDPANLTIPGTDTPVDGILVSTLNRDKNN